MIALAERALARGRSGVAQVRFARRYRFEPARSCLCGATEADVAGRGRELGRTLALVLCRRCGLGRLSPRLAAAGLARYYERDYRLSIRGTADIDRDYFERGVRRGRALLERLAEHASLPPVGSLVLEIGAGAGGILAAFREQGYRVAGCDLDPQCVEYARREGLDVVYGELPAPAHAPVGLIVLSHLLEHLPDPITTLERLRPFTGPETSVFVEAPGLRAGRGAAEQIRLPHLYYYDLTTLEWLFARAGLALAWGDEAIRALFRPAPPRDVDTSGNFERNRAVLLGAAA